LTRKLLGVLLLAFCQVVWFNAGSPTFAFEPLFDTRIDYYVGDSPLSVFCADLDGDTDLDLAVANENGDNVSILKNLTQIPGNSPPYPFSLLLPADSVTTSNIVHFDWATTYDPNLSDQLRYDLYITGTSSVSSPETTSIIDSNLTRSDCTDTLEIGRYSWKVKAKDNWGAETWSKQTWTFVCFLSGDINGDGIINVEDIVYLVSYLYRGGPAPDPLWVGDCNCDGIVNVGDIVYLVSYLYREGPPPGC
jgi:hypothetical protein